LELFAPNHHLLPAKGGLFMEKITVTVLARMKAEGQKITALTAYDFPFARMVDESGVDIILVGDSLGMVVQGEASTLPVTMEQMIYHTRIVARGVKRAMVVGDMPFMSYQASVSQAVENAGRFLKEAGAAAVKLEGGVSVARTIEAIAAAGIPVQAHIGLTPQSVHQMGGYKVQRQEDKLLDDAKKVQDAGAFSVVLEGIPFAIAKKITASLAIPTIGIGAGADCDGQILVLHDLLGLNEGHVPKFAKRYAQLAQTARAALGQFVGEVREKAFPTKEHSFK
jgi:3-methyl-2-oxobutanoate hydroxymethyltransferase